MRTVLSCAVIVCGAITLCTPCKLRAQDSEKNATDPELADLLHTPGTLVSYLDGVPRVTVQGPACGSGAGTGGYVFQLQYLNRVTAEAYGAVTKEDAGFNWKVSTAVLRHWPDGNLHLEIGKTAVCFRRVEGADHWVEVGGWGRTIRLVEEDGYACHVIETRKKGLSFFHADGALAQKFHKAVDAEGHSWHFLYYGAGDGKYSYKLKALYIPQQAWFWQFYYYSDSGFLREIRVCRGIRVEDVLELRYYTGLYEGIGSPGDLQSVLRRRWDAETSSWRERLTVFRYYTAHEERGRPHDLKYVIGPDACAGITTRYEGRRIELLEDALIDDPDAADPVALYDAYFEYHVMPGDPELDGCVRLFLLRNRLSEFTCKGHAVGAYSYQWQAYGQPGSSVTMPYKDAMRRLREGHPDGTERIIEINRGGLVTAARKVVGEP